MLRLIYFSGETKIFKTEHLRALLVQCRRNNDRSGITGLLLYMHGNFFQIIEGEHARVKTLFEVIRIDGRHRRVICLSEELVNQREFPDWSMGFENIEVIPEEYPPGFTDFLSSHPENPNWGIYSENVRYYLRAFWRATR